MRSIAVHGFRTGSARFDVDAGAGDAALVSADGRVRGIVELLVGVGDAASSVRRISRPSSEPRSLCQ